MKRRGYLVTGVTVGSTVLAGCSFTINNGNEGNESGDGGGDGGDDGDPADAETGAEGSLGTAARDLSADDSPGDLLPETPDGWEGDQQEQPAAFIGADERVEGTYTAPGGGEYVVEVSRWPDAERADESVYDADNGWVAHVVVESVTLAVKADGDGDAETATDLLAASPVLSADLIDAENRL